MDIKSTVLKYSKEQLDNHRLWVKTNGQQGDPIPEMKFVCILGLVSEIERIWDIVNNKPYPFDLKHTDYLGGIEFESKEEAYTAAMNYHETEGCKLYLELYPAPEKNGWSYIAQNASGKWYGYDYRPNPSISSWFAEEGEEFPMIQSPPNPFWRKTLQ